MPTPTKDKKLLIEVRDLMRRLHYSIHIERAYYDWTEDGSLITDEMWGIYYKPDFHFGGIQGGAAPFKVPTDPDKVAVDPYGPESPEFIVGPDFAHMWVSA